MLVKDVIIFIIILNWLVFRIESSIDQKYKLMKASREFMSKTSERHQQTRVIYVQQLIGNVTYPGSG